MLDIFKMEEVTSAEKLFRWTGPLSRKDEMGRASITKWRDGQSLYHERTRWTEPLSRKDEMCRASITKGRDGQSLYCEKTRCAGPLSRKDEMGRASTTKEKIRNAHETSVGNNKW